MSTTSKRRIAVLIVILALVGIGVGVINVWKSFKSFEKSIINEKDTQIEKRIKLEDANIEATLSSFAREVRTLNNKSLDTNSIYAGRLVYKNDKYIKRLSDHYECSFANISKTKDYVICTDTDNQIYMAYKKATRDTTYYWLISLENLLNNVIGTEQDSEEMNFLMDCDGKIVVYKEGEAIRVIRTEETGDKNVDKCIKFFLKCIKNNSNSSKSISMINDESEEYTARIVMQTAEKSENEIFAIGKSSNYDATIKPSMSAANNILIYGGLAVIGVVVIILLFIILQKTADIEIQNVTRRNKKLEEINQKMQALSHHQRLETIGTMTAGIAHDFNNLLTPIMGYSMMTMEKLPKEEEELQENLLEIYNATNKAKEIVSRLAELSKKGDALNFEDLNIDELIRNTIRVSYPVKPKNVEVLEKLNAPGTTIKGDKTQIAQMILNFSLNAYDALAENGGALTVTTKQESDKLEIRFIDDGPGMDSETVSKIFDPFFTTKESGKGTGLGLAIIAQIAETHNAKIYVDSELGKGTEFRVVFDLGKTIS